MTSGPRARSQFAASAGSPRLARPARHLESPRRYEGHRQEKRAEEGAPTQTENKRKRTEQKQKSKKETIGRGAEAHLSREALSYKPAAGDGADARQRGKPEHRGHSTRLVKIWVASGTQNQIRLWHPVDKTFHRRDSSAGRASD